MTKQTQSHSKLQPIPSQRQWIATSPALSVGGLLRHLTPGIMRRRTPPYWPPDLYGLAASLLQQSGAFLQVVNEGIPSNHWLKDVREAGKEWRSSAPQRPNEVPAVVHELWKVILSNDQTSLSMIRED